MKTVYRIVERCITVILSVSACLGLFLFCVFFGNLIYGEVPMEALWWIFLGSVVLTLIMIYGLLEVRYLRLLALAEEQEREESELYRHLTENL